MGETQRGAYNVNDVGLCAGVFVAPVPDELAVTDQLTGADTMLVAIVGFLFKCSRCDDIHTPPPMLLNVDSAAGIIGQILEQARVGGTLVALEAAVDQVRQQVRPDILPPE